MGEKRGRAEANSDERQAQPDENTRRMAGMTHDGAGSETRDERRDGTPRRFNQLTTQAIERERQDSRRQRKATQPQEGGRRTYRKMDMSNRFLKDCP